MFTIYTAANIGSARCKGPNKETPKGPEWRFAPTGSAGHFHIVVAAHIVMMMCLSSSPFLFLHRDFAVPKFFDSKMKPTRASGIGWLYTAVYYMMESNSSRQVSADQCQGLSRSLLFPHKYT